MEENDIRQNFANNLSRLRKYNKLSQQELADKLSYSDKAISKWELGDNIPDVFTLHKIASIFNVTVDELISPNLSVGKSLVNKKNRLLITTLSAGGGFLLGIIGLFVLSLLKNLNVISGEIAEKFIVSCYPIAFMLASIVLIVFTCLWFEKIWRLLAISACIWSAASLGFIWANFNLLWLFIVIAALLNILFGVFLRIEK